MDIADYANWATVITLSSTIMVIIYKRFKEPLKGLWFFIKINIKKRFFHEPIKITKTNVIMGGRCQENIAGCISPTGEKPITQIVINNKQRINVCSICLEKNIYDHKWKIQGD